jgi:hypothetical protein
MPSDRSADAGRSDAGFAAWLEGLRFSLDRSELEAVRAAYHQLARMNELNRKPVSQSPGTIRPGADE